MAKRPLLERLLSNNSYEGIFPDEYDPYFLGGSETSSDYSEFGAEDLWVK